MAADGSVIIDTRMDTTGVQNGVSAIKQSFNGLGSAVKKIGLLIGGAFAVGKLVQFGKECVELGSDLAEVQNVVDVTFTTMSDKVNEFAKNAMTSAGLSETMAKQYVGTFGAMSKSFGFSEQQAYDMSTALTQLTGDVASFYNISQDLAYIKLKSVFTGETETLKDLGVVMTQTALDQYALANGYGKTTSAMTEQEKVALRLAFVQKQLSAASGDFIRTSDSWANQVRVMQLQLQSLKATVGQGLINIFTPVLKVINILLGKLATLANAFKSFTELITGKKSSGSTSSSGAGLTGDASGVQDTADAYGQAADNASKLADSTEDVADATKDAAKAANGYLNPLDEISRYSSQTATSTSSPSVGKGTGGTSGGLGGTVGNVDYGNLAKGEDVLSKMSPVLDGIVKRFKELTDLFKKGFWEGLGDYNSILKNLKKNIDSIKKSLKNIFTDPAVLNASNKFADSLALNLGKVTGSIARIGLTIAQNFVGGIAKYLSQNTDRIKKHIVNMFDIGTEISDIIGNFSVTFADVFSAFGGEAAQQLTADVIGIFAQIEMTAVEFYAKLGRDMLNMIAKPFVDNKDLLKSAIEGSLKVIETVASGILTVVQTLGGLTQKLYDEHLRPFFESIANGISSISKTVLTVYNTYILPVLQGLADKLSGLMSGALGETLSKIETFLGKIIDVLKLLWENILAPLINWIIANAVPVLAKIIDVVGTKIINIIGILIKVIGDIADVLSGVVDFIVGVFAGDWEKAWNGVKGIAEGVWNLIKDIILGVWETIKSETQGALDIVKSVIALDFNAVKSIVLTAWNYVKNRTTSALVALKTVVSSGFGAIKSNISKAWDNVKAKTSRIWDGISTLLSGKLERIKSAIINKFTSAKDTVVSVFEGIKDTIKNTLNSVIGVINGAIGTVNSAIGGIESAFSFGPWKVPTPFGSKTIGFSAHFPRVPTVPYLAKGAVIPPRSEFLAVLGDQKQGNNIETPEALLRKIVREETAGRQTGGGSYRFVAQINRRTLFDEMMKEAQMRRDTSGRNPFEMA